MIKLASQMLLEACRLVDAVKPWIGFQNSRPYNRLRPSFCWVNSERGAGDKKQAFLAGSQLPCLAGAAVARGRAGSL